MGENSNPFIKNGAVWIWNEEHDEVNQYVRFRHEFIFDGEPDEDAVLYISADSEYAVWLNGKFVDCGQLDDFPENKAYDVLSVGNALMHGKNVLCVLAYYQGETSFQYIAGEPGLIYALKTKSGIFAASGSETLCCKSAAYVSGRLAKTTMQLGFSFEYNAIQEDNWIGTEYSADIRWTSAIPQRRGSSSPLTFYERPVKKLVIKDRIQTVIIAQGVFARIPDDEKTVARIMQSDFLSSRTAGEIFKATGPYMLPSDKGLTIPFHCFRDDDGVYLIVDMDMESAGFLEIELEACCGTVIDIAHGEHLDDLRVRAYVGGRNFANRYICRDGRQCFIHYFKRMAGRYIQLHISRALHDVTLYYAGLRPCEYPLEARGEFKCGDSLHNKIYEAAVRTLMLCMHEHYEDSPWREQALYAMDARNQALCGYYCFGEYDFPEASLRLLGESLGNDGFLSICAPTRFEFTIPSFSLAWIISLSDHLLYSGRIDFAKEMFPKVKIILGTFTKLFQDGLLLIPRGSRYWHFYEWSEGLDDSEVFNHPDVRDEMRSDAPLSLIFYMALDAAKLLAKHCGEREAERDYASLQEYLKASFHSMFWDEQHQAYRTYLNCKHKNHFAELTQALALCAGVCPDDIEAKLRERLSDENNGMVKITLSQMLYKLEALLQEPEKYCGVVYNSILKDWGYMLFKGATSFWETIKGADDFGGAGSLCHGWSALPVYFYYAYMLGVKPVEPGFAVFQAKPVSSGIDAKGCIPTPYGNIEVSYGSNNGRVQYAIKHPGGLKQC